MRADPGPATTARLPGHRGGDHPQPACGAGPHPGPGWRRCRNARRSSWWTTGRPTAPRPTSAGATRASRLIAARRNLGAVGRNLALRRVTTPYVAFCDDDTWWEPGSLTLAADALDAHPDVAAVTARIVVEPAGDRRPDHAGTGAAPRCPAGPGCPAPRCSASWPARPCCGPTRSAPRAASRPGCGWAARRNCSAADLVARGLPALLPARGDRAPPGVHGCGTRPGAAGSASGTRSGSPGSAPPGRRRCGGPPSWPPRCPATRCRPARSARPLRGLPWVLRERRPVPPRSEAWIRLLDEPRRASAARRYIG